MRILAFWSIVLASLLAVVGLVLSLVGFIGGNDIGMGITGVLLIVVPVAAAIWIVRSSRSQGRPAFVAAVSGLSADMTRWGDASGIALDPATGRVVLAEAKALRVVPATSITEVSYVLPRVAPVYTTGIMAVFAAFAQIGAAAHNFSQAGLYVAAEGQRTRVIGIQAGEAEKWKALLANAKAGV